MPVSAMVPSRKARPEAAYVVQRDRLDACEENLRAILATLREANPTARICVYGLYAPLNAEFPIFSGTNSYRLALFTTPVDTTCSDMYFSISSLT